MTATLDQLLTRYEYGRLAPELFDIEVRAALVALGDRSLELDEVEAVVRLWNPALIEAYQQTYRAAVDAVDWCRYREAIRATEECERRVREIRDLVNAAHAADLAEEAATTVHVTVATRRLQRLPAVAATEQIVDLARLTIVEGHYTRASCIAAICLRMAAALLERREASAQEREMVEAALADLRALFEMTHTFAPPDEEEADAGCSLQQIIELIAMGHVKLAQRLVAGLQMESGGRRRFLLLLQRYPTLPSVPADEIRQIVASRSWDGAFDHYCEMALAGQAQNIESMIVRATAACAAIEAAIEELTPANA